MENHTENPNLVKNREQFLTKTQLMKRGWTEKLILSLLGKPDQSKTNPHYQSGPKMQLYHLQRVAEAEASPAFQKTLIAGAKRKEAAKRAVATKRSQMEGYLQSFEITVPQFEKNQLIDAACRDWNSRQGERGHSEESASPSSDPQFLARIVVNMLRHNRTNYEQRLQEIEGRVGTNEAYLEIKEKVLEAIADAYPWLTEECLLQEQRMRESVDEQEF